MTTARTTTTTTTTRTTGDDDDGDGDIRPAARAHPFAEKINWYAVCADERKGVVIEASAFRCSPPASNPNPPPPLPLPTCMC